MLTIIPEKISVGAGRPQSTRVQQPKSAQFSTCFKNNMGMFASSRNINKIYFNYLFHLFSFSISVILNSERMFAERLDWHTAVVSGLRRRGRPASQRPGVFLF